MGNSPYIVINAPDDGATITLQQIAPTEIDCEIEQSGDSRTLALTNCAASADCQTLTAQTKWLFFTVNVSIDLALVSPTEAMVTINAEGASTVHQISGQAYADATEFIANCKLPPVSPLFTTGRSKS